MAAMMKGSQIYIDAFCDMLKQFTKDVSTAYGDSVNRLGTLHNSASLFAVAFPETCARLFHSRVTVPYGDRISRRDEDFFLMSSDILSDVQNNDLSVTGMTTGDVEQLIDGLRHLWKTIDAKDKDNIWKYLQTLTTLTNKIYC